jgi:hypothetical protein
VVGAGIVVDVVEVLATVVVTSTVVLVVVLVGTIEREKDAGAHGSGGPQARSD